MSKAAMRSRAEALLRMLGWVLVVGGLAAWFVTLAPRSLGGPATFVVVDGVSMEPTFHTGDLVVARSASDYSVDDLVVLQLESGRVIHRIIDGSSVGWTTQGDHNAWVDPWVASDAQILGRYWFVVPGVGAWLAWSSAHWWAVALIASALAALTFVPWRARQVSPALRAALASASRERIGIAGMRAEVVLLGAAVLGMFGSIGAATSAYLASSASSAGLSPWFWLALASAGAAGLVSYLLSRRVFDGAGLPEPERSLRCLSGRLRLVDPSLSSPFVAGSAVVSVSSALELRSHAERLRLPVLHAVDGSSHSFLVVADGVSYGWTCSAGAGAPEAVLGGARRRALAGVGVVVVLASVFGLTRAQAYGLTLTSQDVRVVRVEEFAGCGSCGSAPSTDSSAMVQEGTSSAALPSSDSPTVGLSP